MRLLFLLLLLPQTAAYSTYHQIKPKQKISEPKTLRRKIQDTQTIVDYVGQAYTFLHDTYGNVKDDILKALVPVYTIGVIDLAYGSISNFMRSKITVQKMNRIYDWHKPTLYDVEKIHAGLDELNRLPSIDNCSLLDLSYYAANKSLSDYLIVLKSWFYHVPTYILQVYIVEFLKYQKSGQQGYFSKYNVWSSSEVAQYDPKWPDTVNSHGDYVGDPTTVQKIYACMQGIESIWAEHALEVEYVVSQYQDSLKTLQIRSKEPEDVFGIEKILQDVIAGERTRSTSPQDINSHCFTPDRGPQIQAAGGGVVDIEGLNQKLWHAVKVDNSNDVKFFIFRGAQIDSQDETGATALMYAAIADRYDIVKLLLEYNPNLNMQDAQSWTALHYAVDMKNQNIVKLLLAAGANKNIPDTDGLTPLSIAELLNVPDLINLLKD